MKKIYKHALELPCGPTSIIRSACVVLGMQTSSWLPMASLGQTITTHQGKQLGVTKISSACDRVPMFGLLQPNLTHFVHTIEANWGHALQFCRSPPSTSYTPDMQVVVLLTCCHWFEQSRDGEVMNKRTEVTMENMLLDRETNEHCGVEALLLKILWLCINLGSPVKSFDCCNLGTLLV